MSIVGGHLPSKYLQWFVINQLQELPRISIRSVPTQTGEGINTTTHAQIFQISQGEGGSGLWGTLSQNVSFFSEKNKKIKKKTGAELGQAQIKFEVMVEVVFEVGNKVKAMKFNYLSG